MLPKDRAQPAAPDKPSWGTRLMHAYRRLPTWLKVVVVIAAIPFSELILLAALIYGVVAVVQGRRTVGASLSVALWGLVVFSVASRGDRAWLYSVLLLPSAAAPRGTTPPRGTMPPTGTTRPRQTTPPEHPATASGPRPRRCRTASRPATSP